jgi:hypothetical protein
VEYNPKSVSEYLLTAGMVFFVMGAAGVLILSGQIKAVPLPSDSAIKSKVLLFFVMIQNCMLKIIFFRTAAENIRIKCCDLQILML